MEEQLKKTLNKQFEQLIECAVANKENAFELLLISESIHVLSKICRDNRLLQPESSRKEK